MWIAMRDVPLAGIREATARANVLLMVAVSVPSYLVSLYIRALRWRHLTAPIAPMSRGVVFRATAIGFMANNLLPLRIGEVVRSWYLARDSGTRVTAIFGTVVLERVLDVACVLLIAGLSLFLIGNRLEEGGILAEGARLLAPVGVVPILGLFALRLAPEQVLRLMRWLSRPLPEQLASRLESLVTGFIEGLGALKGGSHLFWIALHSATIWLIFSTIPVTVALVAFGLEMGSGLDLVAASWGALAAVGVAVALPSAPGFLGTYQLAFKAVLVEFGVDPATAMAVGLCVWLVFWLSVTSIGLIVLRLRGSSLAELTDQVGKDPASDRR
jgi:hypothetical protein